MAEIASAEGYSETTIAKLIGHAGISRPTFYEHFDSKILCFIAVERQIAAELVSHVRVSIQQDEPDQAARCAIRAIADFATRAPRRARLLLCESLVADTVALEERDRVIDAIAGAIERTQARCAPEAIVADLPSSMLVGVAFRLIAQSLQRSAADLREIAEAVVGWMGHYERSLCAHRWRSLDPGPPPPPSGVVSTLPSEPPATVPPGQQGTSRKEALRNQRERILHATALVASRSGYNAASVTEILAEAGVDKRTFYSIFANKHAAFMAAHELGFRHTLAVTARAFFSAGTWPERVWESILAGTQFQATHPLLAYVLNVQSYALDRRSVEPIAPTHPAFTIFQHEGNQLAGEPPGETATQATVAAALEIAFLCSREGRGEQMSLMAPLMTYLCLTPYVGPVAAENLIDAKMTASAAP